MALFRYFSQADSDSLSNSYLHLLEECGMQIPENLENSKQLFAEFISHENKSLSTVKVLISWVDLRNKKCSIEVWSDEPMFKKNSLCEKVHNKISELIEPQELYIKDQVLEHND